MEYLSKFQLASHLSVKTQQAKYEAKKQKLKAIKNAWGDKLHELHDRTWPRTREWNIAWSFAINGYSEANDRLKNFIKQSLLHLYCGHNYKENHLP